MTILSILEMTVGEAISGMDSQNTMGMVEFWSDGSYVIHLIATGT